MGFDRNTYKEEFLLKNGVTAGLPLFDSAPAVHLPDWIWSGNGIKGEVYAKMALKFSDDCREYI